MTELKPRDRTAQKSEGDKHRACTPREHVCDGAREKKYPVLKQRWVEHERGWGQRPDGATLHLTREDRDIYVTGYNKTFNNLDEAPDECTKEDGGPEAVDVDAATYQKLVAQKTSKDVLHPFALHGICAS